MCTKHYGRWQRHGDPSVASVDACRCGKRDCPAARKIRAHLHYVRARAAAIQRAIAWNKANPEKRKVICKRSDQSNRERVNATARRYHARHPHEKLAHNARRKAAKLFATPKWLTVEDLRTIGELYRRARAMNERAGYRKYGVDHIVPLKGRNVCGLHVLWNLQIITRSENSKKHNKLLPDHSAIASAAF